MSLKNDKFGVWAKLGRMVMLSPRIEKSKCRKTENRKQKKRARYERKEEGFCFEHTELNETDKTSKKIGLVNNGVKWAQTRRELRGRV